MKTQRQSLVQNIIGLYVGQELPHKLAITIITGSRKLSSKVQVGGEIVTDGH